MAVIAEANVLQGLHWESDHILIQVAVDAMHVCHIAASHSCLLSVFSSSSSICVNKYAVGCTDSL